MEETIRYYAAGSGLKRPYVPLSAAQRQVLHALQRGKCYLCGDPFAGQRDARLRATEDHVKPQARGGTNWHNRLLAHWKCNVAKSDRNAYPCELILCEAIWLTLDRGSNFRAKTVPPP